MTTAMATDVNAAARRGSLKKSRRWALIWSYVFLAIFAGIKNEKEIADLTAFLKQFGKDGKKL